MRRRGTLVSWQPAHERGALQARELVELVEALEALKKRIDAGADVGDYGSNLHLLIEGLKDQAGRKALAELRRQIREEPQMAGPDVEALVRDALDTFAADTGERTLMVHAVVRALREAGVEA